MHYGWSASDSPSNVVEFPAGRDSATEENDVERINQFSFYELGKQLRALREHGSGNEVAASDVFIPVWEAHTAINNLIKGRPIALGVSLKCAKTLYGALDGLLTERFKEPDGEGGTRWKFPRSDTPSIPFYVWNGVIRALDEFETIFREEMREASTYCVPDRGIFNTAKLVESADQSFPQDLLAILPAKTRDDWKAAGRCLAFNLLSASGFHVARAVEGMLESYYQLATGKQKTLHGWNDYIKALEAARTATPPPGQLVPSEKVISELTQMKMDYRNPIMHPRVVLSDADARMLFANGESLIIAMAQEIRSTQQTSPANALLTAIGINP